MEVNSCMSAYELAFEGEILMEKGAEVGADLFRLTQNASDDDDSDVAVALRRLIWAEKQLIPAAQSEMDLARIEAKFDLARDILTMVGEKANG